MAQPRSPSHVDDLGSPRKHAQVHVHGCSPSEQIHHLTQHMSAKIASNVLAEMKLRSQSTVTMARGDSTASYASSSSNSDDDSDASSLEASPTTAVAPLRMPMSPPRASPRTTMDTEALLMPGKAFLTSFYTFLKEHRKSLRQKNPRLQVVLNPPCVHYLEHCFHAMLLPLYGTDSGLVLQWETKKDAPNSPTNDAPSGMSKTQRMLKLAGFVLNIVDLHIQAMPEALSLPSQCNLAIFSSLMYLKVDGIPLAHVTSVQGFKKQLLELTITNVPLQAVADVLGSIEPYESSAANPPWTALTSLSLVNCGLTKLDASLALAPALTSLNLSSNQLTSLNHLENCAQLGHVNVSNNAFTHLDGAHRYLGNVTSLVMHHNRLSLVKGIEKMYGLQSLDLSHNDLRSLTDVAPLAALPLLTNVTLLGNDVLEDAEYRFEALQLFGKEVVLDADPWSPEELQRASFVRQRRKSLAIATDDLDVLEVPEPTPPPELTLVEYAWRTIIHTIAPKQLHDMAARVVMTCVLLVLAQTIATMLWSRDKESEEFITLTVASIGGTLLVLALPLSMLTYVLKQAHLTSAPPVNSPRSRGMSSPKPPMSPRMQRELATNSFADGDDDEPPATPSAAVCSLSVLSTALEVLAENAEHMPVQDFLVMCREVAGLLHLLGPTGAFALKTFEPDVAHLDAIWRGTDADADVTLQALMGAEEEANAGDEVTSTVLRLVPTLSYVRNLCLEMEMDREHSLRHCASKAYLTSMAKQQKHPWLVQKAVLSAMQLNPMTRDGLVALWSTDDDDAESALVEERLHACGHMLDILLHHLTTWYEAL
ncbi:nischarin-like [Achlya hypogyna]|uniref:Nischarin-like n=1 Tax=Achlya hypogyna TaxID=1202772 RepID=A0A1V9YLL0_ACHHY|nr:nischarin-like [Achlya hypogyna]